MIFQSIKALRYIPWSNSKTNACYFSLSAFLRILYTVVSEKELCVCINGLKLYHWI